MLEQRIIHAARRLATGTNAGSEQHGTVLVSKNEIDQLRLLLTAYDSIASAQTTPICPQCGTDEIEELADAWFARQLAGFKANGETPLGSVGDTRVFDDRHFVCTSCGHKTRNAAEFRPAPITANPL